MGELSIMDKEAGDIKIGWNPEVEEEVKIAQKKFTELKKDGYRPFRMWDGGKQGEQLDKFDKFAEQILFLPPIMGG